MKQIKNTTRNSKGKIAVPVLLFLVTVGSVFIIHFLIKETMETTIRNTILVSISIGSVIYALQQGIMENTLSYDNKFHLWRFFSFYVISLILSLLFVLLPVAGWAFLAVAVTLSIFSNETVGILSSITLIFIAVSTAEASSEIFLLYFITGVIGIELFKKIDESFKILLPSVISLMILLVAETAVIILFMNETLNDMMFTVPVINLFMNGILLVIVLKYFSNAVVHKYRILYMEINDPEFKLMADLKERSKEDYYRAIHTAYFCERIATALSINKALCKAGGFYQQLDAFIPEDGTSILQTLEEVYFFPPEVLELLEECDAKREKPITKEAAIVIISDEIISTISYFIRKNPEKSIDYVQIIEALFEKNRKSGILNECDLSLAQYYQIKSIFKEEKLYYDFLH